MDINAFRRVTESIQISEAVALEVSLADDQKLQQLAASTFDVILNGPESPNAAIGALIALMLEAVERRFAREDSNA